MSMAFQDIVSGRRTVYGYAIYRGDVRITVSLQTVEFVPDGAGTRMILTEQIAILDGSDKAADRERGIGLWLDKFVAALGRA